MSDPLRPDPRDREHDPRLNSSADEAQEASPEESRTFISDEFGMPEDEPSATLPDASSEEPAGADSRTIQSEEFLEAEPAPTLGDAGAASEESRTFVSDEFSSQDDETTGTQADQPEGPGADSKTMLSDEFEEDAGGRTFLSDEFGDDEIDPQETFASDPDGPRWTSTGQKTVLSEEFSSPGDDSRTLQSDHFESDPGVMAGSDIRQTINPKSLDSRDREAWESVIRGALGSQAPSRGVRRKPGGSSSNIGGGTNLNIQTRTLVEGTPVPGAAMDYRIETKLGEGGMGAVYLANQTSLNRGVALKVIKPISDKESVRLRQSGRLETIRAHREGQFLSEAVVTGDLEHPNIVPIYDVAATQDGTVFYAMKCVAGTPWSKVIRKKPLSENIDVLMKVCDAMAFAHSRGVVHRDLKPENIMLGEFGVVLVMDWGLALVTKEFSKVGSVRKASSLGGSPAYMAPELATGPLDAIGPAADIYLIGAMLYESITGRPPHSGSNVSQCLRSAATNKIDPAKQSGELMDIALKAMAAKPSDRYPTVQAFQDAVRGYLEHAESIGLAQRAKEDLESARQSKRYADFARAMFGFEQALDLWSGNEPARQGLSQSQLEYAELALAREDYELGLSLLDDGDSAHLPIVNKLRRAQAEQESRKHRLTWMKRIAAALLAVIFLGGSGALAVINDQKNSIAQEKELAEQARDQALIAEADAKEARDVAVAAEERAKQSRDAALLAKAEEEKAKEAAIALRIKAEQSAEAERMAKEEAVAAKMAAEAAAAAEKLAKEKAIAAQQAEEIAKQQAIDEKKKAVAAAEAEKKAKEAAVAAALAEEKAKQEAIAERVKAEKAAAAETLAKNAAVAAQQAAELARQEAVTEREKAEMAAAAEKLAKEKALAAQQAEEKAKVAAIKAEQEAVAERIKAEMAAVAEMKAKEEAVLAQVAAEKAAAAEKKAKELETAAKLQAIAAKEAETKAKDQAIAAQQAEERAKERALAAQAAEEKAKQQALYEAYIAKIGLAKASIDQNEFDFARATLEALKADPATAPYCGWEWSRLMHQATQATGEVKAESPALDVTFHRDGRQAIAVFEGGRVRLLAVNGQNLAAAPGESDLLTGKPIASAALAPGKPQFATGGQDGVIRIWSLDRGTEQRTIAAHDGAITKVRYLNDGLLLSSSVDKTVRVWDVATGKQLADAWHIAAVQDVAFSEEGEPCIAAAVADSRSGRGVIWKLRRSGVGLELVHAGDFVAHGAPVQSVAVTANGQRVATGSSDGRVFVWERSEVTPLDYGAAIDEALDRLSGIRQPAARPRPGPEFTSLTDSSELNGTYRLITADAAAAHDDAVRELAFSTNGERLLSAADDFTIKVWNPRNGALIETLRGHGGWVRAAAFSPSSDDVVLSAGYDRSVKAWKISRYSENVVLDLSEPAQQSDPGSPDIQAHEDEILSARFSRDGGRVITTSRDQTARLWNVRHRDGRFAFEGPVVLRDSGASAQLKEGHEYLALSMQAAPDGRTLLLGGVDGTVRAFDVARGTQSGVLSGTGLNTAFALSDDGRLLLTASSAADVSAQLWELGPQGELPERPRLELKGHEFAVTAFAISSDGSRLFTGDQRGIGIVWDARNGQRIGAPLSHHQGLRINAAAFLPDGRVATASDDASVAINDPAAQQVQQTFRHAGFVTEMELSADGRRLITISERTDAETGKTASTLSLWDLADGKSRSLLTPADDGPGTRIRSARLSRDGGRLATVHGEETTRASFVRVWRFSSDGEAVLERTLRFPPRMLPADAALLLPGRDGELVSLHGNAAYLWNLQTLENLKSYRPHSAVGGGAFSADGEWVATCSESVKIWRSSDAQPVFRLEAPHAGRTLSVEFSPVPGETTFVTAGSDGVARLWNWDAAASKAELVQTLQVDAANSPPLHQAVFSPDGTHILTVGEGGRAHLWRIGVEAPVAALIDHAAADADYLCGAFAPDGQSVVAGAADKQARVWNISAEALAQAENPPSGRLQGHADQIESVVYLPASTDAVVSAPPRILTGSRDRSARLWDAQTGREIISLRRHSLGLTAVDAVQARIGEGEVSTLVLTAGLDGRAILWPAGE